MLNNCLVVTATMIQIFFSDFQCDSCDAECIFKRTVKNENLCMRSMMMLDTELLLMQLLGLQTTETISDTVSERELCDTSEVW